MDQSFLITGGAGFIGSLQAKAISPQKALRQYTILQSE
jgi:nucleoside-diphosphate-sugar epimerase